jgi:hypothetical protein
LFERHRVGKHGYTYSERLKLDPPAEDGRRCLSPDEFEAAGLELDGRRRWTLAKSEAQQAWFASLSEAA